MTKTCKGPCGRTYDDSVWLSDLGECSICHSVRRFNKEESGNAQSEGLEKWLTTKK
jgi:hypothetical protein